MTAENDRTRTSGAVQGNPAGGVDPQPASADTDSFFDAHVSANRCLKGALVALQGAAAELSQLMQGVGAGFYAVAQSRLGLAPATADFYIRLAKSAGLDAAQFSPVVEVKLARLMATLGTVVGLYNDTAAVDDMPTTSATTPAGNGLKTAGDAVGAVADAVAAVSVDAVGQDEGELAAVPPRVELTAGQRQFIAARSVKLLVRVTKGELTPEAAMRQAEKLPPVKGKRCTTGPRHTGAESAK